MSNRTKTYIAGDWDGDSDAITQLHKWNDSSYWGLHFVDVHELTSSKDYSLNCSIKSSLRQRMKISKTFVLIVGEETNTVRSGSCSYCLFNNSQGLLCSKDKFKDNRSYVQFECDLAKKAYDEGNIKIVVLYNSTVVKRGLCPEVIRWIGTHAAMKHRVDNYYGSYIDWDYPTVKNAIK